MWCSARTPARAAAGSWAEGRSRDSRAAGRRNPAGSWEAGSRRRSPAAAAAGGTRRCNRHLCVQGKWAGSQFGRRNAKRGGEGRDAGPGHVETNNQCPARTQIARDRSNRPMLTSILLTAVACRVKSETRKMRHTAYDIREHVRSQHRPQCWHSTATNPPSAQIHAGQPWYLEGEGIQWRTFPRCRRQGICGQ